MCSEAVIRAPGVRSIDTVRRVLALICALSVAAVTAVSAGAALPKLHVVLKGQDHHPLVGKKWHYSVTVTNTAGKPVASKIHLQFLFSGLPVGQIGVHTVKNGFWQETFGTPGHAPFPPAARGQKLVIEAIVTAKGYAVTKATWPIVVK
jgi:hypothetical protein